MIRYFVPAALLCLAACGSPQAEDAAENPPTSLNEVAYPPPQAAPAADPKAQPDQGQYTSLDPADCRLIEENREEGGYARHACPGLGGYKLETSESDLRNDVVVIAPDGRRSQLNLSSLVANGAFNSLGKTAEWRGHESRPDALIVRLNVAAGPEPTQPDISNLVVAKLASPACIVAVVPPGEGQNAKARRIADGNKPLPACIRR